MSDLRRRTRWLRELAEPQSVQRADVWSFDRAAQSVGLDGGLARGTVHARLVYKPEQKTLCELQVSTPSDLFRRPNYLFPLEAAKKTQVGRHVPKALAEPDPLICCSLDVTTSAEPHTQARTSTSC